MVSGLKRFLWIVAAAGCAAAPPDYFAPAAKPGFNWAIPSGFPAPAVPADNPMSTVKVELGRRLFYDKRLSGNQTFSCASCHRQALAFSDGRDRAIGSTTCDVFRLDAGPSAGR